MLKSILVSISQFYKITGGSHRFFRLGITGIKIGPSAFVHLTARDNTPTQETTPRRENHPGDTVVLNVGKMMRAG